MLSASQEIYSRRVRLTGSEPWEVIRGQYRALTFRLL